ncbi:hypothetical protein [Actinoplanes sp. HUAS TT8]|uniref:hypothetical protein n=1 Tax=Actinoplanes sp. HUAS TT8 TaxID=3447453 RepID=UPI003F524C9B
MSGNGVAVVAIAVLLLAACADGRSEPAATAATVAPGACGVVTSLPDGATLRAEDVGARGGTNARYAVLGGEACGAGVARRPEHCETFPWATEMNLYALGARGWLVVGLGSSVREQIVFYAKDSSFADTYVQAAQDCGFTPLTVIDGEPATLERNRPGRVEIVHMTARSVIWLSSTDPGVTEADLVRLSGIAEDRSAQVNPPS